MGQSGPRCVKTSRNVPKPVNEKSTSFTKTPEKPVNRKPKGVSFYFNNQRPARPYAMRWKAEGKVKTQFFETEEDRQTAVESLMEKRQEWGKEVLTFNPREWRTYLEAKEIIGETSILDVAMEWRRMRGEQMAKQTLTVREAVKQYLEFRAGENLSSDTMRHIKKHVGQRFVDFAGQMVIQEITAQVITTWLSMLRSSKGPLKGMPVDPLTRKHHRKDLNTFLDWCVRNQWIDRNPCELVPIPKLKEEDVELLTVEEGQRLFSANRNEPVIARIALEAFGFLRASSAGRLKKDQLNFKEKGIRLIGAEHKSGKTRYRQGHPENLWKWLALATDETWAMDWWKYRNEKTKAFVRAGISGGSENRLRKTCLSAHLAWLKNQPLTSYLAQHRHMTTTDIYLGVMSESDGKAWFEITP